MSSLISLKVVVTNLISVGVTRGLTLGAHENEFRGGRKEIMSIYHGEGRGVYIFTSTSRVFYDE